MDNSPARGTRDLLPATVATREHVLGLIEGVYRRFGYQRIETPALERIERLTGGQGGENEKLLFRVLRRGLPERVDAGTDLAGLVDLGLRYDLTVPLTRFYSQHRAELSHPFRSFQFGPVWRAERPQKGRYRQFAQCDIDLVGEPSVLAEVELIEATTEALAAVGLTGTTLRLSDRRFLAALAAASGVPDQARAGFFVTVDKLDKIGWDGVQAELVTDRGLPAEVVTAARDRIEALRDLPAGKLADLLTELVPGLPDPVAGDLATTATALADLPAGRVQWSFDPTLVRGMGYYTGQVFEISHPDAAGSIAGGGRYDELIGRSLGAEVPACGFSIGFERIVDLVPGAPPVRRIAVLYESDVPVAQALAAARALRRDDVQVAAIRRSGKLPAQLSKLESWGYTAFLPLRAGQDPDAPPEPRALGARPS